MLRGLVGGLLLAVGILIAGASGLCTLVFVGEAFSQGGMGGGILLIGIVPFLIGLLLAWGGWLLLSKSNKP